MRRDHDHSSARLTVIWCEIVNNDATATSSGIFGDGEEPGVGLFGVTSVQSNGNDPAPSQCFGQGGPT